MVAGTWSLLYKYGGSIFLQMFVKSATIKEIEINGVFISPLIAWGELIGVGRPARATQAQVNVDVVINTGGPGNLDPGLLLTNSDNGVTYILQNTISLAAPGTFTGLIRASADQAGGNGSGVIGNLNQGDLVSFVNPVSNINRDTTVQAPPQPVLGIDQEDTEVYRQKVFIAFQKRVQGGALVDYEK